MERYDTQGEPRYDYELTDADIVEEPSELLAPVEAEQAAHDRDHQVAVNTAQELIRQRAELMEDLETALNACRGYAGVMERMHLPDPHKAQIDPLLAKYKMDGPREWPSGQLWSRGGEKSIPARRKPVAECTCDELAEVHDDDCPRGIELLANVKKRQEIAAGD